MLSFLDLAPTSPPLLPPPHCQQQPHTVPTHTTPGRTCNDTTYQNTLKKGSPAVIPAIENFINDQDNYTLDINIDSDEASKINVSLNVGEDQNSDISVQLNADMSNDLSNSVENNLDINSNFSSSNISSNISFEEADSCRNEKAGNGIDDAGCGIDGVARIDSVPPISAGRGIIHLRMGLLTPALFKVLPPMFWAPSG
ncbi:hypothetical protein BGZ65_009565, partial [Modicella reniformis]